jgi:hypothetical protein
MAEVRDRNFILGNTALAAGIVLTVVGALWAHFTGLPEVDDVGRDLYAFLPRGWGFVLIGQLVSLAGAFLALAGIAIAYLYEKPLTWARAAIGAGLFTALMIILFGIIPNQWLTYTQAVWEWTDQKLWIKIPTGILGGNEVNISAAAIKDIVSGTYAVVATGAIATAMIRWQKRDEIRAAKEKEDTGDVSAYGRPLRKAGG